MDDAARRSGFHWDADHGSPLIANERLTAVGDRDAFQRPSQDALVNAFGLATT